MKYEENLKRITLEKVEERLDAYGDHVPMYQLSIDGRPIGSVTTWEKAKGLRHWLATTIQDLEGLLLCRMDATPDASSSGNP